ncbi:MAG: hypothetical protein HYX63_00620 [Gammaproteobacteria bacterium]|nr:hypothetical protein [Gammaproteobacteria bacterium]
MSKLDRYERKILSAFDTGKFKFVATRRELEQLNAATSATAAKDRRVNNR